MEAPDVMQMAADHTAKAEEFMVQGSPSQARLHIEHAKLLVTMAREVRIGNSRSRAYHGLVFKPVVLAEPLAVGTGDGVTEFDDEQPAPFVGSHTADELAAMSGQERQDEALRLGDVVGVPWGEVANRLGYASGDSAREAARSARLRRDQSPVTPEPDVPTGSELGGPDPQ